MRLVASFKDVHQGSSFATLLTSKGIDNQLEEVANNDWGSTDYGTVSTRVWVINEDRVAEAQQLLQSWVAPITEPTPIKIPPPQINSAEKKMSFKERRTTLTAPITSEPMGKITLALLIICTLLLVFNSLTQPSFPEMVPKGIPTIPLTTSPLYQEMMFDFPAPYSLVNKLVRAYGLEKLQNPEQLPESGKILLVQIQQTPYWAGFYDLFLGHFRLGTPIFPITVPLFEKIREGEIWRFLSPCFLHSDLFHLFFNMIWLAVIGRQLEARLKAPRYLLFIIATGVVSNTIQYLVGGPNFIGFSGVLCAMLGFIWVRQRKAPWEGYQLQGSTLGFMLAFILTMFAIQIISFILESYADLSISPGIANTAHIAGAIMGALLGYFDVFAKRIAIKS